MIKQLDYPVYRDRLECATTYVNGEEGTRSTEEEVRETENLLKNIDKEVGTQFLRLLQIRSEGRAFRFFSELEKEVSRRNSAWEKLSLTHVFDDIDENAWPIDVWDLIRPYKVEKNIDYKSLFNYYNLLDVKGRADFDILMYASFNTTIPKLFEPMHNLRTYPDFTTKHLKKVEINGLTFVKHNGKLIREDVYFDTFQVNISIPTHCVSDEWGDIEEVREKVNVGNGATLEMAIEVAYKAVDLLALKYDGLPVGNEDTHQEAPERIIIKVLERGEPVITGNVEVGHTPKIGWNLPILENEVVAAKEKIKDLLAKRYENSMADNYSTCHRLTSQIRSIEERYPKAYQKKELVNVIDKVERLLDRRSLVKKLINDELAL